MTIRIFVTGGTFDKEYNELSGELFFKDTHLSEMLTLGRSQVKVEIRTLMMIDSLDMSEADRDTIAQNCLKTEEDKIVITHGTDTMVDTARVLAEKVKNKTIILTGAMIFGYFLTVTGVGIAISGFMTSMAVDKYVIFAFIVVIYLILGCLMDSLAMVLITVPIFYPLMMKLGFDPIWFGVIIVIVVEMGMITPPVGMNVFVIKGIAGEFYACKPEIFALTYENV